MSALKELKKRISTVKSTKKITKAMKMVAAAKLRKASQSLERGKLYHLEIEKSLSQIISSTQLSLKESLLLNGKKNITKHLYIIGGAERGLCGGFNSNLVKFLNKKAAHNDYLILCLNSKIYSLIKHNHANHIIDIIDNLFAKTINYSDVKDMVQKILTYFYNNEIGSCSIIYNKFHSILFQETVEQSLIPYKSDRSMNDTTSTNFEFEPKISVVLEALLKKNLESQIYYALLENNVSEQGARMNAMENATKNADQMIKDLTLQYNRNRQANITKELIEIISGSEAM